MRMKVICTKYTLVFDVHTSNKTISYGYDDGVEMNAWSFSYDNLLQRAGAILQRLMEWVKTLPGMCTEKCKEVYAKLKQMLGLGNSTNRTMVSC